MSNYTIKLNLSNLEQVGIANLQGKHGVVKCVVIPIEPNKVFVSEKGIYLDLVAIETPNNQYGDTHFVKRSLTKEEREQEIATGQRIGKVLGNMKEQVRKDVATENMVETYSQITTHTAPTANGNVSMPVSNETDLPF